MRDYAITYQQLIRQAVAQGLSDDELIRIRNGYDVAVRITDGLYRKQMVPFICHLVRTSSIVMHETRELAPILASMLHAVYFLNIFSRSTRRGPRQSDRVFLKDTVGGEVERLIADYSQFRFGEEEATYWAAPDRVLDDRTKQLLMMRLADELEDHLDAAESFVPAGKFRAGDTTYGVPFVELAGRLGLHAIAEDFHEALKLNHEMRLPEEILSPHGSSFELRNRLWTASPIERTMNWLRRLRHHRRW